ncbi:hypothetical protein OE88DRAFT_1630873 [Heliocybe sulcata]|uniref:SAP domain-containing protein n=1 Tax=Heliocybe sulcata TaxID=5364 RepID=A0A5C3N1D5_9AGAM|nr:hypothetical protein OE88DRAFT_1630873 [Heliocybe sulcata]
MVQRANTDTIRPPFPDAGQRDHSALDLVHTAYRRLEHEELILFLKVRSLPTTGSDDELASRLAHYDINTYNIPGTYTGPKASPNELRTKATGKSGSPSTLPSPPDPQMLAPDLPVELIAEIMDRLGDWELSKAVGVPTSLPRPLSWTRACHTDEALLTGYLPVIRSSDPGVNPPTKVGTSLAVRFGYVHVLAYFFLHHRDIFLEVFCPHKMIPTIASNHGRIAVLSWLKHTMDDNPCLPRLQTTVIAECIDGASRHGQVASLDWWLQHSELVADRVPNPLPFEYTDYALEFASAKNHIAVLQWWKTHNLSPPYLPLKPGRSLDFASTAGNIDVLTWWASSSMEFKYDKSAMYLASCHGKVDVLKWWLQSGLRLQYDGEVLVGATKHNRPEVLEWWDKSGLEVQYRMCDVEEALEDAIGGGEEAREWWKRKGVDFNTTDKEWTQLRNLN